MDQIVHSEVVYPPTLFSPTLEALVRSLLQKDPQKRASGDTICSDPWFADISWKDVFEKQLPLKLDEIGENSEMNTIGSEGANHLEDSVVNLNQKIKLHFQGIKEVVPDCVI